ncbi:hypothetical protein [Lysinibacillus sphaericus]|uniref:Fibronectin type-III domain-containing protein n=1 Tax=Lysinibacillus sphaericus OT4b.31 TaxID=1285586 RepID=R7Z8B3_LYSSH|nr:hypothetical protein [Lysinibacillus sphaericus]EON70387.1 hypothetical protein H131_21787 [Lysinibacillus sphaericus OT4b.31]
MVKYYYDKYNTITTKEYNDVAPWEPSSDVRSEFQSNYREIKFNKLTGNYDPVGGYIGYTEVYIGDISYYRYEGIWNEYTSLERGTSDYAVQVSVRKKDYRKNTSKDIYTRGTLVQSNVVAENNTYPLDGRHTDGFWYVRGSMVNTAPTQPGAFTQPSGSLEIGDSKVISWGASTDANNNLSKYILEVAINNGSWTQIGTPTTNSYPYTIPTATSIQFRVKAQDSGGLESSYRTSSVYTVTKPKYYYAKYMTVSTPNYTWQVVWGPEIENQVGTFAGYTAYYLNGDGDIILSGTYMDLNSVSGPTGTVYADYSSKAIKRVTAVPGSEWFRQTDGTSKQVQTSTSYSQGALVESNISAVDGTYPANGRHTDGFWYVRGSRVSQSIAPPAPFTAPTQGKKFKPNEVANIAFGASSAANLSLYEVDYRYNSTGTWTQLTYNNTLTRSLTITTDKTLKTLELRVRAKNTSNVYSDYVHSEPFDIEHNVAPTVSLTGPSENQTLYENDTFNIVGTAFDADPDQAVTTYYQIDSELRKVLATNLSQMQIALSKQLIFKSGKLYDGETPITGSLADGIAHKLKVWAEDSEKASSAIDERSFYVVPNRAPLLSVDAVVPSGVVDNDKFKISGTVSDPDANSSVTVKRRINNGNSTEVYNGPGGAWEFDVSLAQLIVGLNTIVVEVVDNYGAKASKTITLNKNEVKTPILQSVARYKITPPSGTAKGVLLFIERDEPLDLKVELSMTLAGEQEQYETLTPDNTAPMPNMVGIVEDTYFYESTEPKDNIILKLFSTRPDATVNHKIHLISGAVE